MSEGTRLKVRLREGYSIRIFGWSRYSSGAWSRTQGISYLPVRMFLYSGWCMCQIIAKFNGEPWAGATAGGAAAPARPGTLDRTRIETTPRARAGSEEETSES